jgi:hypothetical protein
MGLVATLRNAVTRLGVDLGRPDGATAQAVVLVNPSSGDVFATLAVEPLGTPVVARKVTVTTANANTVLTTTCRRISIKATACDMRFAIGDVAQTASATTSHFIEKAERLDFAVPLNANIAVIRDSAATADGVLHITELS